MKRVAKLLIQDQSENFLLLYLNNHPAFGDSADLPGGTVEEGESIQEGMVREVLEETGIVCMDFTELYSGTEYSKHGTHKALFLTKVQQHPRVTLSWEHSSYTWVPFETLVSEAKASKDDYMHMVAAVLTKQSSTKSKV